MSKNTRKQARTDNVGDGLNLEKHNENGHKESDEKFEESEFEKEILTNWINGHLRKVGRFVVDLFEELRDGKNLICLLEVLTNASIPRNSGRLRGYMIRNVKSSLSFLESSEKMDIANISAEKVVDGSPTVILSLISRMKLHFRHSDKCNLKNSDTLNGLDQRNGHRYGELGEDHGSNQFINSTKDLQSASNKVKTSIPRSVTRKSDPEFRQLSDEESHLSDSRFDKSFWLERMKSIRPLRFPFKKSEPEVESRWCTTDWLPSLLDAEKGNAKLILLDAFVIYLARLTGETNLHIGWNIEGTSADEGRRKRQAVLVPMIVSIDLNKSWEVVSTVLDDELLLVTQNHEYLLKLMSRHASVREVPSLSTFWPWQIAITNSVQRSQDTTAKGEMLTLDIDARGNFRWIYNASRLAENVLHEISEHLRELVRILLLETNINTPICELNVLARNGGDNGMETPNGQTKVMKCDHDRIRSGTINNVEKHIGSEIPINPIMAHVTELTPHMLPLIDLTQADINRIISQVSEGLANIQDIYDLSPLQDEILYHHLLSKEGDSYLFMKQLAFLERDQLDKYLLAVQRVVDRHDILRTAFFWEELNVPAQVVLRQVILPVTELEFESDRATATEQLRRRYYSRRYRIDLHQAPLLRYWIAQENDGRWILHQLAHRLIGDKTSFEIMDAEITAFLTVQEKSLSNSVPFRNFIADARFGASQEPHLHFFTEMLADVLEPTLSFAVPDVNDRDDFNTESNHVLPYELHHRLRTTAKDLDVGITTLCHLACARVISCISDHEKVVFCTTLHWQMQADRRSEPGVGLFINTIPFRIDIDNAPIHAAVRQTHMRLTQLKKHEHVSLAQAQGCSRVSNNLPLFNTLFHYQHKWQKLNSSKITGAVVVDEDLETSNYPLTISVDDYTSRLCVTVRAVNPIQSQRVCAYMGECLKSIADALELTPDISVRSLNTLPGMERTLLIETWNSPVMVYSEELCIHQLFEKQADETPTATALIFRGGTMTYGELNSRANCLARKLIEFGAGPEQIVGVCVARSPAMVIGILAILKAGAAYLPLDPIYSSKRMIDILHDAVPRIVLADQAGREAFGDADISKFIFIDPNVLLNETHSNPKIEGLCSKHLAYIMYTSGSTGKPKGVMVEHRNIVRLYEDPEIWSYFNKNDVWCLAQSIGFDASVQMFWGALRFGSKLLIAPHEISVSPRALYEFECEHNATVIDTTPSIFKASIAHYVEQPIRDRLRFIFFGGERLDPSMLKLWFASRGTAQTKLVNVYGPTETTIFATYKTLNQKDTESFESPIGSRLLDLKFYLLDSHGQPVPIGVTGELYIGGAGVARGYLNRPDLTSERFLPDGFSDCAEDRVYKTNDLARYLPDGNLMFIGRNDRQIKIRGFRVEPGEVEACLAEYPAVTAAAVIVSGKEIDKRLIAYIIVDVEKDLVQHLRLHVAARLPDYMVPSAFVKVDSFPLTSNGKLDVSQLPAPDETAVVRRTYEEPNSEIEKTLVRIWGEQLGIESVGRYDSFFELGGHSLLAVRFIECMHQIGLTITVQDVFQNPILSELASKVRQRDGVEVPPNVITPHVTRLTPSMLPLIDLTQADINRIILKVPGGLDNIQDIYALSPLQEGILFHHLLANQGDAYQLTSQIAFSTRDLLDRYMAAIQCVVDRHDILRTVFAWEELSKPAQVVLRKAPISATIMASSLDKDTACDQLDECRNKRRRGIDIRQAPLLRFSITQDTDGRWLLHQLSHHLIVDQTTLEVMSAEIAAFMNGEAETLSSPVPFRNLIANVRFGLSQEAHMNFFTELLVDIQEPSLSFGLLDVHHDGSDIEVANLTLSAVLNDRLRKHAKNLGVSLAALFHLAWAQIVSRTSGQENVVFGTVLFGRTQAGLGSETVMGLFINTLPVRIDVDEASVVETTRKTHLLLARLLEHEHASLALAQRCSRVTSGIPLFNTLLNYRHNLISTDPNDFPDGIEHIESEELTNYPMTVAVDDIHVGLGITAQAIEVVNPKRLCSFMQQAIESIIDALELTPQISVRSLEVLPKSERSLLTETWNSPAIFYPTEHCIHHLFEQHVLQFPNQTALIYGGQEQTYAELNAHANKLAHNLIKLGVGPEKIVAICVDRSPAMVIGILGILKAGGAYLPLDPIHTSNRIADILNDASPNILLVDVAGRSALKDIDVSKITLIDPNVSFGSDITNPNVQNLTPEHLAYVIYTSGSTGKPKGVMIEHRNIVRLLEATNSWFQIERSDVWCLLHSITFDVSVWEIWGALRYGAKLVLVPYAITRSPQEMYQFICEHQITILNQTPSAFKAAMANYVRTPVKDRLRYIFFGGERLDPCMLRPWFDHRDDSQTTLVNMYGPAETTFYATYKVLNKEDTENSLSRIGSRISDLKLYLLDTNARPVPIGVTGEMYISGPGVARGYLNRPELSCERFLVNTFGNSADDRMYKTGDFARYLPDGNLVFIGRNDQQIKIRGFRVELGEVEACLAEHPAVHAAIVLVHGENTDKSLISYVVADDAERLVQNLRLHVAAHLPEYMVPAAFVRMDSFPLTLNGKIDVEKLPMPDENAIVRQTYIAPVGEIEKSIATVWSKQLGIERISRYDSFFELGGHSLLAVRIIEGIRSLGLTLGVQDLFQQPILYQLARKVGHHSEVRIPQNVIEPNITELTPSMLPLIDLTQADINRIVSKVPGGIANIQDIYSLSPLQDGILFHHILDSNCDAYATMGQMGFTTRDLLDRYLSAVQRVVERHDVLRTMFLWEDLSTPAQVVLRKVPVAANVLKLPSEGESVANQLARIHDPRGCGFDISQAPLLRYFMAQETDGRWILHQLFHHLVADHTTLEVMSIEIAAFMDNRGESLGEPVQFRNLIANVRFGAKQNAHEIFFTEMLADVHEPSLSFGLTDVYLHGTRFEAATLALSQELNQRLRNQARHLGVSLAAIFHLACGHFVSRTSGQDQAVFGTVLLGRTQLGHGADTIMGLFINTLPVRIDVDESSVRESIRKVHSALARLLEHEHASLVLGQRCSGIASGTPLFNTLLNYRHNSTTVGISSPMNGIEPIRSSMEISNYPLNLSVDDDGLSLGLVAQTVSPFEPKRLCSYMLQSLESMIDALESTPQISVRSLDILPKTERTLLVETWNSPLIRNPVHFCIHHLFEQQVTRAPDEIALIYEGQKLSYAELNSRANRLAHDLIGLGVRPEQIVAICVDRSLALIIGILAILKAGGAYLPLDPAYSSKRIIDIVNDAKPDILIADFVGRTVLNNINVSTITVIDPNLVFATKDSNPDVQDLTSRNLAYVMYTSGSTGKPKGVMVEHHNIVRLFDTTQSWFRYHQNDVLCMIHSMSFDISVTEVWGALRYGGTLVLVPHNIARSPKELYRFICQHNVTVITTTPSAFKAAIEDYLSLPIQDRLRCIFFGGERFDPCILRSWFSVRHEARTKLINVYGPTETSLYATYKVLNEDDITSSSSPIGSRLSDVKLYLLDKYSQPVPIGVTGELYIGGAGVARGYLNRPDLTDEFFISDTFNDSKYERLYKTGDLARFSSNGSLVYIGRNDQQVKIRGFRIELGEIEACLMGCSAVHAAAVIVSGEETDNRLIAYVVTDAVEHLVQDLRSHVAALLPSYMVPSAFVTIDALPLTLNGKLDVRKLPPTDQKSVARSNYEAPHGQIETSLAAVWSAQLGVELVSRYDSYFELGGHSLLAVRMIRLAAENGLVFSLQDLFRAPVLADLASKLCSNSSAQQSEATVVRSEGTEPPMFFVPTGSGDVSYVHALARYISPGFPIYALSWPSLRDDSEISSLEELASEMIVLIKNIQHHGPYRICGYSAGGVLCHSIACQLLGMGDSVDFIGFIDTLHPTLFSNLELWKKHFILVDLISKTRPERHPEITSLIQKINSLNSSEFIRAAQELLSSSSKSYPENYEKQLQEPFNYIRMVHNHSLQESSLTVHQFYAIEPPEVPNILDIDLPSSITDPSLGWAQNHPKCSLQLIPISGNHSTMMERDDNRLVLGNAISMALLKE